MADPARPVTARTSAAHRRKPFIAVPDLVDSGEAVPISMDIEMCMASAFPLATARTATSRECAAEELPADHHNNIL